MANIAASEGQGVGDDDSDWEYEYHETETESFYVTLDLSSAKKSYRLANQKEDDQPKPATGPTPTSKPDAQAGQNEEDVDAPANPPHPNNDEEDAEDEDDDNAAANTNPAQDDENDDVVIKEDDPASEPSDRIQILDFHSSNPIISYQNQLYSCNWTSTIGTDVLLTDPDSNVSPPILKQEAGVTILGMANIKLFGRPAQISTRDDKAPTAAPETSTAAADAATDGPPAPTPAEPVKIPVTLGSNPARHKQARFLERLIAIKAAKGEKDEVTVYASKEIDGFARRPPQQEVETENPTAVADDADTGDASAPATPTAQEQTSTRNRGGIRRPRGSTPRSSRSRAKRGGGLFQEYKTTSSPTATPLSWSDHNNDNNSNTSQQPIFNTPPPVPHPTSTHHPPTSHPNTDPPHTDYTKTDTAPNAPPDPNAPHTPPAADLPPMNYSTTAPLPTTATGSASSVPKAFGGGRGIGAPAPGLVGGGVGNETPEKPDLASGVGTAVGDVGVGVDDDGVGGDVGRV